MFILSYTCAGNPHKIEKESLDTLAVLYALLHDQVDDIALSDQGSASEIEVEVDESDLFPKFYLKGYGRVEDQKFTPV